MEALRGRRLAGISGVAYFFLSILIVLMVPPLPTLASTSREITEFYARYQLRFLIGNYAGVLAIVAFFPLLAYTTQLVRRAEGDGGIAGMTIFGAGIATHAMGACSLAVFQVVALVQGPGTEPSQKALSDLANVLFGLCFILQAALAGAGAWGVLSTNALPRALGYAAIPVTLASFVASGGTIVTTGPLAAGGIVSVVVFGAYLLWTLALSVILLVRKGAVETAISGT